MESKWAEPSFESKKTPDLDQMDLEQYQVIIILYTHTHYWLGLLVAPRVSLLTATPINLSSLEANPYHDECELA